MIERHQDEVAAMTRDEIIERFQNPDKQIRLIRIYRNIAKAWQVPSHQLLRLIDNPSENEFASWESGAGQSIPANVLERLSYVVAVFHATRLIYGKDNRDRADAWVQRPNKAFGDRTPLEVMINGNPADVRRYLDDHLDDLCMLQRQG